MGLKRYNCVGQFKGFIFLLLFAIGFNANAGNRIPAAVVQARDNSFKVFHDDIHPVIMSLYNAYMNAYGETINNGINISYEYLAPKAIKNFSKLNKAIYNSNPRFFDETERIPATFKIAFEDFLLTIYGLNYSVREAPLNKPLELGAIGEVGTIAFKVQAGILKSPKNENIRLNKLLNDLRPYITDQELASCFRVHAVPVNYDLAATLGGCNIYLYKGLYDAYTDQEIRAILAHEISHIVTGDSLKKLGLILKTVSYHITKLSTEELNWVVTGDTMQYLEKTGDKGSLPVALETLNKGIQQQELRADKNGVLLLNAAGFSGNDALAAIYRLEGSNLKKTAPDYSESHPSGYDRAQIIKRTMKF